ncbi:MAG: aspartate ammonia-lyase [Lentisphaerae bacterium RIFOXYA12_FULL_48_11]|nr:MAG: aspartate ammonia-lyase [Lentisphaerae bacterium RIFOXYA12_FULL_48_11]
MKTKSQIPSVADLASILVGVSGEYFVAAELTRRGYIASITLKNTRGIDVLASNEDASKSVGIQVKTNSTKRKDWILNEKAEKSHSNSLFYIFVNLSDAGRLPDYYVVPSRVVASYVKRTHREWLAKRGRHGRKHRDNPMRHFKDEIEVYRDRWDLLKLSKKRK